MAPGTKDSCLPRGSWPTAHVERSGRRPGGEAARRGGLVCMRAMGRRPACLVDSRKVVCSSISLYFVIVSPPAIGGSLARCIFSFSKERLLLSIAHNLDMPACHGQFPPSWVASRFSSQSVHPHYVYTCARDSLVPAGMRGTHHCHKATSTPKIERA